MTPGDISMYTDQGGVSHPAIVSAVHADGTVDLAVLRTTHRNVSRSTDMEPGKFFDPTMADEAPSVDATADVISLNASAEQPAQEDVAETTPEG
jgi:hypothetical protein